MSHIPSSNSNLHDIITEESPPAYTRYPNSGEQSMAFGPSRPFTDNATQIISQQQQNNPLPPSNQYINLPPSSNQNINPPPPSNQYINSPPPSNQYINSTPPSNQYINSPPPSNQYINPIPLPNQHINRPPSPNQHMIQPSPPLQNYNIQYYNYNNNPICGVARPTRTIIPINTQVITGPLRYITNQINQITPPHILRSQNNVIFAKPGNSSIGGWLCPNCQGSGKANNHQLCVRCNGVGRIFK
ncbi:hypothetical protein C1645_803771 [Glomus cerebriforme]|uniref:Uncharacterized protein n=1 Tax=Glomus cerebriforme TaxID=658196 RepID=A0A397TGH3_9GLOM|nr:hypothetical protein C1645_803771 [Glomus cerebriforme]